MLYKNCFHQEFRGRGPFTTHFRPVRHQPGVKSDAELDMLDTLPDASAESRLSCQIRVGEQLNGAYFKIMAEEEEV